MSSIYSNNDNTLPIPHNTTTTADILLQLSPNKYSSSNSIHKHDTLSNNTNNNNNTVNNDTVNTPDTANITPPRKKQKTHSNYIHNKQQQQLFTPGSIQSYNSSASDIDNESVYTNISNIAINHNNDTITPFSTPYTIKYNHDKYTNKYDNNNNNDNNVDNDTASNIQEIYKSSYSGLIQQYYQSYTNSYKYRKFIVSHYYYSELDIYYFMNNDFSTLLNNNNQYKYINKCKRKQWNTIRKSIGKIRRFSRAFIKDELNKLHDYRQKIRYFVYHDSFDLNKADNNFHHNNSTIVHSSVLCNTLQPHTPVVCVIRPQMFIIHGYIIHVSHSVNYHNDVKIVYRVVGTNSNTDKQHTYKSETNVDDIDKQDVYTVNDTDIISVDTARHYISNSNSNEMYNTISVEDSIFYNIYNKYNLYNGVLNFDIYQSNGLYYLFYNNIQNCTQQKYIILTHINYIHNAIQFMCNKYNVNNMYAITDADSDIDDNVRRKCIKRIDILKQQYSWLITELDSINTIISNNLFQLNILNSYINIMYKASSVYKNISSDDLNNSTQYDNKRELVKLFDKINIHTRYTVDSAIARAHGINIVNDESSLLNHSNCSRELIYDIVSMIVLLQQYINNSDSNKRLISMDMVYDIIDSIKCLDDKNIDLLRQIKNKLQIIEQSIQNSIIKQ